jgi:cytoskeleton protein RodZ
MSDTTTLDNNKFLMENSPGAKLSEKRILKNYTVEYVANKLHLRVRMIELLENDDYNNMPEPVFIKGYLRSYAKLLGMDAEALIEDFRKLYSEERRTDKALWQSRRESNKAEHAIRWITSVFAVIVLVSVAMWWQANKENEHIFTTSFNQASKTSSKLSENEIRLTDLSKMRSILATPSQDIALEKDSG